MKKLDFYSMPLEVELIRAYKEKNYKKLIKVQIWLFLPS